VPAYRPHPPPADAGAGPAVEAAAVRVHRPGPAPGPEKGGLVRRLKLLPRDAVVLFLDATVLRLFPPLRSAWAFRGQQAAVRISGRNDRRVLFGAINPRTGHRLVARRPRQRQEDFQAFLRHLRARYPGRPLWLLLDRARCHEALRSQQLAGRLGVGLLWLPTQCPELNPVDHLWRELKRLVAANRQFRTIDEGAGYAERWFLGVTARQALRKAGTLSEGFWLRHYLE
jgi:transposase